MYLETIVAFLDEIGLPVRFARPRLPVVVPGVGIEDGTLVIDRATLAHEGDVLHEAGHLAVLLPRDRGAASGALVSDPAHEMAAIAWSYAAARYLAIPTTVVFHADGYRGGASALARAFDGGSAIGAPMLQWYGLAAGAAAVRDGAAPYPAMLRWTRDG